MTLQKKLANKIKEKKGITLIGILLGVVAFGVLAFPLAKWIIVMTQNIAENEKNLQNFSDRLEMQSIVQDYWQQMNSSTYDEFQAAITAKGKKWTENVGSKYTLTINFSDDGKYDGATCRVGTTAGASDRHCCNVSLSIVSKSNASLQESLQTTRVSIASESAKISELESKLSANESKFSQYYKKTESDSRYIKKGAKS